MSLRKICVLAGMLVISACNRPNADQIAANGAIAADEAIEDADTRAEHLADQSEMLHSEAERVTGASRRQLENESREDMSEAIGVEQRGDADAEDIAKSADVKAEDATRH